MTRFAIFLVAQKFHVRLSLTSLALSLREELVAESSRAFAIRKFSISILTVFQIYSHHPLPNSKVVAIRLSNRSVDVSLDPSLRILWMASIDTIYATIVLKGRPLRDGSIWEVLEGRRREIRCHLVTRSALSWARSCTGSSGIARKGGIIGRRSWSTLGLEDGGWNLGQLWRDSVLLRIRGGLRANHRCCDIENDTMKLILPC